MATKREWWRSRMRATTTFSASRVADRRRSWSSRCTTERRLPADAPLDLKIDARGGRYDFYYATRPNEWTPLMRDADGTILSTKKAGGFVGTFFGMYAYSATPQ